MRNNLRTLFTGSSASRQNKNLFKSGRDAQIVSNTNYGTFKNTISFTRYKAALNEGYSGCVSLLDGRVFFGDRVNYNSSTVSKAFVYDPTSDTAITCDYDYTNNVQESYNNSLLLDGRVFLGPYSSIDETDVSPRIYDPSTNIISKLPGTYQNGRYAGGIALLDGRVFFPPFFSTTALVYDPSTGLSITSPTLFTSNGSNGGVLLHDGRVAIPKYGTNQLVLYDPKTNTAMISFLPSGIDYGRCCLMADGKIFIINYGSEDPIRHIIYDPITNTSTLTASTTNLFIESVYLLPDGRLWMTTYSNKNNLYDPIKDIWETSSVISDDTYYLCGSVLATGQLLLAPGFYKNPSSSTLPLLIIGEKLYKDLPLARTHSPFHNYS